VTHRHPPTFCPAGACAPLAAYAAALGIACGAVFMVMYVPQIAATVAARGAEALSYWFLSLHIVLGVGAALQKADGTHERALTWAPPLVANAMQVVLVCLQLYYDEERREERRRSFASMGKLAAAEDGEEAPLAGGADGGAGYGAAAAPGGLTHKRQRPERWSRAWWLRYL
jgi:hypothetical protein